MDYISICYGVAIIQIIKYNDYVCEYDKKYELLDYKKLLEIKKIKVFYLNCDTMFQIKSKNLQWYIFYFYPISVIYQNGLLRGIEDGPGTFIAINSEYKIFNNYNINIKKILKMMLILIINDSNALNYIMLYHLLEYNINLKTISDTINPENKEYVKEKIKIKIIKNNYY